MMLTRIATELLPVAQDVLLKIDQENRASEDVTIVHRITENYRFLYVIRIISTQTPAARRPRI
jgi:hypothetical protein